MQTKLSISIPEIIDLLGPDALLLHWPLGSKGTRQKWGHLTVGAMGDAEYLRKLATGNVGVALGQKSGGLCSIDIDADDALEDFLALNPDLRATLITKGARGGNIWIRVSAPFPRLKKLQACDGQDWGEWRADGGQTIIAGRHPNGMDYRFLNKAKPIMVRFEDIHWPESVVPPVVVRPKLDPETPDEDLDVTEQWSSGAPEPPSTPASDAVCDGSAVMSVDVGRFLPIGPRQNNRLLFKLARALKDEEERLQRNLAEAERRAVFDRWYAANKHLRPGQSLDEYWIEFWEACENAKRGLKTNPVSEAWEAACRNPLPPEAVKFEDDQIKRVVALCWELQQMMGAEPFFLSCHDVARLVDGNVSPMQASRWLRHFCRVAILREVEKGSLKKRKASRYHYVEAFRGPSR